MTHCRDGNGRERCTDYILQALMITTIDLWPLIVPEEEYFHRLLLKDDSVMFAFGKDMAQKENEH